MQIGRLLVSKKELKTLGIPYSFQHIVRLVRGQPAFEPSRRYLGPA
jgi:hypothetical protein